MIPFACVFLATHRVQTSQQLLTMCSWILPTPVPHGTMRILFWNLQVIPVAQRMSSSEVVVLLPSWTLQIQFVHNLNEYQGEPPGTAQHLRFPPPYHFFPPAMVFLSCSHSFAKGAEASAKINSSLWAFNFEKDETQECCLWDKLGMCSYTSGSSVPSHCESLCPQLMGTFLPICLLGCPWRVHCLKPAPGW